MTGVNVLFARLLDTGSDRADLFRHIIRCRKQATQKSAKILQFARNFACGVKANPFSAIGCTPAGEIEVA